MKLRRIGFSRSGQPPSSWVEALQRGLRDLGYAEGKKIVIEVRFAEGSPDKLRDLAGAAGEGGSGD